MSSCWFPTETRPKFSDLVNSIEKLAGYGFPMELPFGLEEKKDLNDGYIKIDSEKKSFNLQYLIPDVQPTEMFGFEYTIPDILAGLLDESSTVEESFGFDRSGLVSTADRPEADI